MDLELSGRADYGVRAALALGRAYGSGELRKLDDIATAMAIPRSFAPQVLGDLVRAGIVEARTGRDGGYRLARAPTNVNLLELVEAIEGPLVPRRCTLRGGACRLDDVCPVHPAWVEAAQALRRSLSRATLAEALAAGRDLEAMAGRRARALG